MTRLVPELPLPGSPHRPGDPRPTLPSVEPVRAFRYGADLWNHGFPWEAHEVWEGLWRAAPAGDEREALKGLIQAAAARYAAAHGRLLAASRLAARARKALDGSAAAGAIGRAAAQVAASLALAPGAAPRIVL